MSSFKSISNRAYGYDGQNLVSESRTDPITKQTAVAITTLPICPVPTLPSTIPRNLSPRPFNVSPTALAAETLESIALSTPPPMYPMMGRSIIVPRVTTATVTQAFNDTEPGISHIDGRTFIPVFRTLDGRMWFQEVYGRGRLASPQESFYWCPAFDQYLDVPDRQFSLVRRNIQFASIAKCRLYTHQGIVYYVFCAPGRGLGWALTRDDIPLFLSKNAVPSSAFVTFVHIFREQWVDDTYGG